MGTFDCSQFINNRLGLRLELVAQTNESLVDVLLLTIEDGRVQLLIGLGEEYVKGDNMPWPVVKFDQAKDEKFTKYSSSGIPYLVLIDADGKNLTGQPGNQWESPQKVLQKIEELVPAAS